MKHYVLVSALALCSILHQAGAAIVSPNFHSKPASPIFEVPVPCMTTYTLLAEWR